MHTKKGSPFGEPLIILNLKSASDVEHLTGCADAHGNVVTVPVTAVDRPTGSRLPNAIDINDALAARNSNRVTPRDFFALNALLPLGADTQAARSKLDVLSY